MKTLHVHHDSYDVHNMNNDACNNGVDDDMNDGKNMNNTESNNMDNHTNNYTKDANSKNHSNMDVNKSNRYNNYIQTDNNRLTTMDHLV